jgi:molybdenum cofactor guanylyltransferase
MGQDKAALRWGAGSLLDHMRQLLLTVAAPVRIIGRSELPDRLPGKGPLGGILTGLETTDSEDNLFVAVDLPLLTPDFLKVFHSRFRASSNALLTCRISGAFPLCLGVRRSLVGDIAQRLAADKLAVREFIEQCDPEVLEERELRDLGIDLSIFANINTPEDWQKAFSLWEKDRAHRNPLF